MPGAPRPAVPNPAALSAEAPSAEVPSPEAVRPPHGSASTPNGSPAGSPGRPAGARRPGRTGRADAVKIYLFVALLLFAVPLILSEMGLPVIKWFSIWPLYSWTGLL